MRSMWMAAALVVAGAACGKDAEPEGAPGGQPGAGAPPAAAPAPPPPDLRLEVDAAARELRVYRRDQLERTYGVAVGQAEWPTQNGEWTVNQVIWNPGWTPPPDEEWTEDEEPKDPGDPDNPLGRVQLAYDPPRTIHGTNQPESIGKAASHGSIRMRNEDAVALARMVMEAGGAHRDEAFFTRVERERTRRVEVPIPNPIPIRVIGGADDADAVEGEQDEPSASRDRTSGDAPRSGSARTGAGTARVPADSGGGEHAERDTAAHQH